jgi:hypothetical protein
MNEHPFAGDESVWAAGDPVVAAIESGLVNVRRITSVRHYLALAAVSRERVASEAYRFPPPPFPLSKGWTWFTSGADFKSLANYSPSEVLHHTEFHHDTARRGTSFLLRDQSGHCWEMIRL